MSEFDALREVEVTSDRLPRGHVQQHDLDAAHGARWSARDPGPQRNPVKIHGIEPEPIAGTTIME